MTTMLPKDLPVIDENAWEAQGDLSIGDLLDNQEANNYQIDSKQSSDLKG